MRKTTGYNDNGQPIYKYLGYFANRKDALIALSDYNANPYDLNRSQYTFQQLYEEWSEMFLPKYKESLKKSLVTAYGHCEAIYDIPYRSLKRLQMQECIDNCGLSQSMQSHIRNLFLKLDEYAFEMDMITKMYSPLLTTSQTAPVRQHIPFTNDEIKLLWEHEDDCAEILFMLYTGMRVSEAGSLPTSRIKDGLITWGMKTKAGKDRVIPIHPRIQHIVDERMSNEVLFGYGGYSIQKNFAKLMKKYGMNHLPHDCRHTFRSELDRKGANKVCIDLLMGHTSKEIGERIYTHKTVQELIATVALVTY